MISPEEAQQLSDTDLIALILRDQNNFALLVHRYQGKLSNFIKRITNIRDEDVQDLLQEVFLKIYLNLNGFEADMKFSSWAYAITRNQVISHHRKISVRPEGNSLPLEDEISKKIISDTDMEKEVDTTYLKNHFYQALKQLPIRYQEVLVLKFLEEKNYQEISDIIKKPLGTVGSMINKAKKDLKNILVKNNLKM